MCLSWEFTSSPFSIWDLLRLQNTCIAECLQNIACIYRYLELKDKQFEVVFYLNYIRMYKPRTHSPRGPYMCYVYPVCTHSPCFSGRSERNIPFKPFCTLRGSLLISVAKTTVVAVACFHGSRAVTQKVGQVDMGKQCSGCYRLEHSAGASSQLL